MREQTSYKSLADAGFAKTPKVDTEVSRLSELTLTLTRKGEIPSPEVIRASLLRHLARYDMIVRFCLNAFIISGLLGTLFNLWKLGPSFWEGIISGKQVGGQPAIGIAFSASVFGLGLALTFSLIDSLLLRFRRESFVLKATAALFDVAGTLIPPTERAAVAEALQKFYSDSEGLLNKSSSQHEELSRTFITQIQSSSGKLDKTMGTISDRWMDLIGDTATTVGELGDRVGAEVHNLTIATARAEQALTSALPLLRQAEDLGTTLLQIRLQAEKLQAQITAGISEFSEKWRSDLIEAFESHSQGMEAIYSAGLSRFDEGARSWHEQNVAALNRFSENIEGSMVKWSEERQKVAEQIDTLIDNWRRELGQSTTGVSAGLSNLRSETEALKLTAAQLAKTQDTAFQQLRSFQAAVGAFSKNVVDGTPLGEAINELNASVKEFSLIVSTNGNEGGSEVPSQSPDSELIRLILQELKALSARVSASRWPTAVSPPMNVDEEVTSVHFDKGAVRVPPQKRSLWNRVTGPLRRNAGKDRAEEND